MFFLYKSRFHSFCFSRIEPLPLINRAGVYIFLTISRFSPPGLRHPLGQLPAKAVRLGNCAFHLLLSRSKPPTYSKTAFRQHDR